MSGDRKGKAIVEFGVCQEADRAAALRLVLASLPAEQRGVLVESLRELDDEPLGSFEALVVAKKGGRLLAAAWLQPQPGRTASLWPPRCVARVRRTLSATDLTRLIAVANRVADERGVAMTQTLLVSRADPAVGPLEASGFGPIATLKYLEWTPSSGSAPAFGADDSVRFEPNAAAQPERLTRLVESTYVDTLDCPGLEGIRDVADALAGYKKVGEHDPALWFFIQHADHPGDAAVLLLSPHPASRQLELVYMGVSPAARGAGLGAAAVRKAQRVATERGLKKLVLAVDEKNGPAMRVYSEAGFNEWASRVVYVRRPGEKAGAAKPDA